MVMSVFPQTRCFDLDPPSVHRGRSPCSPAWGIWRPFPATTLAYEPGSAGPRVSVRRLQVPCRAAPHETPRCQSDPPTVPAERRYKQNFEFNKTSRNLNREILFRANTNNWKTKFKGWMDLRKYQNESGRPHSFIRKALSLIRISYHFLRAGCSTAFLRDPLHAHLVVVYVRYENAVCLNLFI